MPIKLKVQHLCSVRAGTQHLWCVIWFLPCSYLLVRISLLLGSVQGFTALLVGPVGSSRVLKIDNQKPGMERRPAGAPQGVGRTLDHGTEVLSRDPKQPRFYLEVRFLPEKTVQTSLRLGVKEPNERQNHKTSSKIPQQHSFPIFSLLF